MANSSLQVLNPATLDVVDTVETIRADQLDSVVATAQASLAEWRMAPDMRRHYLRTVSELIATQSERLSEILTAEQGKPLAQARLEIGVASRAFAFYADMPLEPEVLRETPGQKVMRTYHAIGCVGLVTAWNFPAALLAWKTAPALLAGNAALIKPAPTTPLTALALADIFDKVLPTGLVQVLVGDGELGQAVVAHPAVEKISFTGSTVTGRHIMRGGADRLKRLTLELGGNDPAVILPDADVESAVRGIASVAYRNAGQVCIAPKRVLAPAERYDEVVEAFSAFLSEQVVGDGAVESTTIGPVNNQMQQNILDDLESSVRSEGGVVHRGARVEHQLPGYFVEPGVVSGLGPDARLVREEQFGPLLPVLPYTSVDAAVDLANDTEFGLGSSVWGNDIEEAVGVADRIRSGTRWVNQHGPAELDIPFGGVGQSGLGTELGREGLLAFTEARITNIKN